MWAQVPGLRALRWRPCFHGNTEGYWPFSPSFLMRVQWRFPGATLPAMTALRRWPHFVEFYVFLGFNF